MLRSLPAEKSVDTRVYSPVLPFVFANFSYCGRYRLLNMAQRTQRGQTNKEILDILRDIDEGPNIGERIFTLIFQVVGFVVALLFGVFTILQWQIAEKALYQADKANLFAFLALCATQPGSNTSVQSH
jgi:hypothetical protein